MNILFAPVLLSFCSAYFSGKMLAKMGRIALIAEEMGRHEDAQRVAARLAEASQVRGVVMRFATGYIIEA